MTRDAYRHRYRLPTSLGGGEYEGIRNGTHVLLNIPDIGVVPFDATVVTQVVPHEPSDGSFVAIVTEPGTKPNVWSRHDDPLGEQTGAAHWWWHDKQHWCTWTDVYSLGIPRRMVFGGLIANSGGVRGLCGVCQKMIPLRVDGRLSVHGPNRRSGCDGSNGTAVTS